MFMDLFKALGNKVIIVSRTHKETRAKVDMPTLDRETAKPLLLPVEVRAKFGLSHYRINQLRRYQPVRNILPTDITQQDIPVIYWGNRFLTPFPDEVKRMAEEADYVFSDTEMYVRLSDEMPIQQKHIQYVHFPSEGTPPVFGKEPERLWCNSVFTQSWVRIRWGFNIPAYHSLDDKYAIIKMPRQIYQAQVVNPPIYVEDYRNELGFKDRYYDVVMFARLGTDKFTVADFIDKRFKLLTMGALSKAADMVPEGLRKEEPYRPAGKLQTNVTFRGIKNILPNAKVYVHGKGFGETSPGIPSPPEHFGITVCEAMASGLPAIVPRAGGCWTDIAEYGKYCLGYSSWDELKQLIQVLTTDEAEWTKWHERSLEGVQRYDFDKIKEQVKGLL